MKNKNKIISLFLGGTFIFTMTSCAKKISEYKKTSEEKQTSITTLDETVLLDDNIITTTNKQEHITSSNNIIKKVDYKYAYATNNVNFRDDSSLDSNIIDNISAYDKLEVIDEKGDFLHVSYNGKEGYVYKQYTDYLSSNYVEVDISEQKLFLYVDDDLMMESNVVTGNKNTHDTPLGCNYIYDKQKDTYLTGSDYKVHVENWIPFLGGYGIHDAEEWRSNYSQDQYLGNGSHGCINMKLADANKLYDNVTVSKTKVLIHK